jgi:hypothetical protein
MACIIEVSVYIYIRRYRNNEDGLCDREYIFWRPWGRKTSSHYTKYSLYLAQLQGEPENHDRVNSGIHSKAVVEGDWRCTLEAVMEQHWKCTWRP